MGRNIALGALGEDLAAQYLTDAGLTVVDRNWRCRYGELDLIAVDEGNPAGDTIVFVEVKTRSGLGYGSPAEAVTYTKQRRIRLLAQQWLTRSGRHWPHVRFDVVGVLVHRHDTSADPQITHLPAVF
ncbi:YraN family protein [Prescottella sp. R16]|uniref:YraN family protein n=1 Tax=Prescottella sp. R16 TaxID=3064529 RepID=UPI00272EA313|nr:YraN family protein [Prescottella sp. R16]